MSFYETMTLKLHHAAHVGFILLILH